MKKSVHTNLIGRKATMPEVHSAHEWFKYVGVEGEIVAFWIESCIPTVTLLLPDGATVTIALNYLKVVTA